MPNPTYQGTNNQGNRYTNYDNGAYRYSNTNEEGKTTSSFYDTGSGHSFYRKNGPEGYHWHENQNQQTRNYIEKSSSGQKSGSSSGSKSAKQ